MFTLNNKHYLCIVDYHSKFPIIKKAEDLIANILILTCKVTFAEYGIPRKIMSDSGCNFISDKFKTFYKNLNIERVFSSSYHHKSNGQVGACIKFIKHTLKKYFGSRVDPCTALLQIFMTPLGQGISCPATMLFNYLNRCKMPIINSPLVGIDNDQEHYEVILKGQIKDDKSKDTPIIYVSIPIGSTVVIQ